MGIEGDATMRGRGTSLNSEIHRKPEAFGATTWRGGNDPDAASLLAYLGEIGKGVEAQNLKGSTSPDGPGPIVKVEGGFVALQKRQSRHHCFSARRHAQRYCGHASPQQRQQQARFGKM